MKTNIVNINIDATSMVITGTVATSTASVFTAIIYSTITTIFNDKPWTVGRSVEGSRGLQTGGKVDIGIGVAAGILFTGRAVVGCYIANTKYDDTRVKFLS